MKYIFMLKKIYIFITSMNKIYVMPWRAVRVDWLFDLWAIDALPSLVGLGMVGNKRKQSLT